MTLKFEKNYSDYKKNGLYEDNTGKNKILRLLQKLRQKIKVVWANKKLWRWTDVKQKEAYIYKWQETSCLFYL